MLSRELLKGDACDPEVTRWLGNLTETPVTTIITRAELAAGVAALPQGRRRATLAAGCTKALSRLGVCLPLTEAAADRYGVLLALRRAAGRPMSGFDGLIAAICVSASATLATRNTADFEGIGLSLVNPWDPDQLVP